jgi:hypothetical protein
LRSIAAGVLALAIRVTGSAQNAHAAPRDVKPAAVDPYSVIIERDVDDLSASDDHVTHGYLEGRQ